MNVARPRRSRQPCSALHVLAWVLSRRMSYATWLIAHSSPKNTIPRLTRRAPTRFSAVKLRLPPLPNDPTPSQAVPDGLSPRELLPDEAGSLIRHWVFPKNPAPSPPG